MCPWILHDHDFLLSKGRNLHFHYLSAFVFLVELKDSFVSESATDAVLRLFYTADPLGQHDLGQPVDTEATSQRSGPPHHDLRPQRQKLPVPHDLSPCEYISACVPAPVSARLFILLSSVTDLFMSAWKSTRLATIRPHFASSESPSPQFSWTHTYFAATCADPQWVFPAAFSKQYAP